LAEHTDLQKATGFNQNGKITIGVDAKGNPHQIDKENYIVPRVGRAGEVTRTDFPHRPPPNVESVSCELNGSNSSFPNFVQKDYNKLEMLFFWHN
jgi:hypothetical protein